MKTFMKDQPHWSLAAVAVLVVALYWSLLATDRYVSESHIVLQSPEVNPAAFSVSSLLSGTSGAGDLLLLKDHLQSVDILQKLEQRLALRQHYSNSDIDWFSRLSAADLPQEKFVEYMHKRITIEFDDYAAILRVKVQAYDAADSPSTAGRRRIAYEPDGPAARC
jgi:capsular polysaccharide transport system permease protein